ncbi:MAG TPA: hypothetical protein VLY85_04750, partial [Thermoplasmata archaeon]|nr:hypothetical protein [Thermoplasmata archaeon]
MAGPSPSPGGRRRFARLRPAAAPEDPGISAVPSRGLCLSAFLILRSPSNPRAVLLGRLDPTADWTTIGGLDPGRLAAVGTGWMLPSSQLVLFESPQEAAVRIVREQLESAPPELAGPRVFSEAYGRPDVPGQDLHWDLHFVFEGTWPSARPPRARPFAALEFVDVGTISSGDVARSQADVLELVGLR